MTNNNITELNIKSLFSDRDYRIPVYQRNYAWGEAEITQLIQDIADFCQKQKKIENQLNYYIGTLIVFERKEGNKYLFETIDGQQRLTTLTILLSVLKNEDPKLTGFTDRFKMNLEFDCRKSSTETLHALFDKDINNNTEYNQDILQAYKDCTKSLKRIIKEKKDINISDFCEYLFNYVYILRVNVPHDTDLNHYFEIMNSRGEQLEKHEILKAKCMEILPENEQYAFNVIWEACSNMEKYIQYGFSPLVRNEIFDSEEWNILKCSSFDEIVSVINEKDQNEDIDIVSIENIIKEMKPERGENRKINKENKEDETPERFSTIINFSNFLLHVLRIQTKKDISLDDKQLIESFDKYLKKENLNVEFVRDFGYNLLKCKYLFDKYLIKREFLKGDERWSLKRLKRYENKKVSYINTFGEEDGNENDNREIIMLISMFHVSFPTLVYKHWLNAVLKYVFENVSASSDDFRQYLQNLATAFLYDRFLAKNELDYYDIIYKNNSISTNNTTDISKLNKGTDVENFVFNFLDYKLWKKDKGLYQDFEFSYRSSVEHYYPQNPIDNNPRIVEKDENGDNLVDNFGNLCLISRSKNSRLGNLLPDGKKDYYRNKSKIDSIKQKIMLGYPVWRESDIKIHGKEMTELLLSRVAP